MCLLCDHQPPHTLFHHCIHSPDSRKQNEELSFSLSRSPLQAHNDTNGTAMESQPAVNDLLARGNEAIALGDRAAASQRLHEATKVPQKASININNRHLYELPYFVLASPSCLYAVHELFLFDVTPATIMFIFLLLPRIPCQLSPLLLSYLSFPHCTLDFCIFLSLFLRLLSQDTRWSMVN